MMCSPISFTFSRPSGYLFSRYIRPLTSVTADAEPGGAAPVGGSAQGRTLRRRLARSRLVKTNSFIGLLVKS